MIVQVSMPISPAIDCIAKEQEGTRAWMLPLTEKLRKRMNLNTSQFFNATVKADGNIRLGDYAPWQTTSVEMAKEEAA